jgi:hypothetical protein
VTGWCDRAREVLQDEPNVAVVCGRRRERFPQASGFNLLCDLEWNTPVGEALACGGDAMMRVKAIQEVTGYNPSLIAGEEPELCLPFTHFWSVLLFLLYPLLMVKIYRQSCNRTGHRSAFYYAFFCAIVKFPELQGQLHFHLNRLRGDRSALIEYK